MLRLLRFVTLVLRCVVPVDFTVDDPLFVLWVIVWALLLFEYLYVPAFCFTEFCFTGFCLPGDTLTAPKLPLFTAVLILWRLVAVALTGVFGLCCAPMLWPGAGLELP